MAYEKEDMEVLQERYSDILKIDYIECDIGWFDILDKALSQMLMLCCETGESIKIVQIKEKFGGLRFYIQNGSNEMYKRIVDAENQSYETCETCGEKGEIRRDIGWWMTLCETHYNEKKLKYEQRNTNP